MACRDLGKAKAAAETLNIPSDSVVLDWIDVAPWMPGTRPGKAEERGRRFGHCNAFTRIGGAENGSNGSNIVWVGITPQSKHDDGSSN
jgi:hypothetical protein